MARKIYGEVAGKVLEIQNWRERASGDAVVMQPLDADDAAAVRALRGRGMDDSQIFAVLHPEAAIEDTAPAAEVPSKVDRHFPAELPERPRSNTGRIRLSLDELPDEQLVFLLERVMGHRAESLVKLERADLVNLVRFATKATRLELSFQG